MNTAPDSGKTPPSEVRGPLIIVGASLMTIAAIAVPYGSAAIFSADALISAPSPDTGNSAPSLGATAVQITLLALGLLLGAGAVALLGGGCAREWLAGRRSPAPGSWCLSAGLALTALMGGYALMLLTGIPGASTPDASAAPAIELTRGIVLGGIGEELIVLALPVVAARALAPTLMNRPRIVCLLVTVLVIIRMSYHVHYGAWALSLLPWAITTAIVYLTFGQVWPLILQHAGYNLILDLEDIGLLSQTAMLTLLIGSALTQTILGTTRAVRDRRAEPEEP